MFGPYAGFILCEKCTKVLKALVTEHQDKDVMSGIIEEITPEEEATEIEHEEQEQKRSLQSLDKTLKRNRRKDDA